MNAFTALVWKELREGAKWAALGAAGLGAALTYALHNLGESNPIQMLAYSGASILSSSFLTMTTFGGPIVALLIALAQTIPESRGDKWGFLVHRPVTKSTLFFAKVLAGLILYSLASGIPFACSVAWVATPGHLAVPFDPRMSLAGIADLSCGMVYYFAGLLTGMRLARWYGSRTLGIAAGIICSAAVTFVPTFALAELVCLAGILNVGTSAWGTFLASGNTPARPIFYRLTTGLTLSAGLGLVLIMACAIVSGLIPGQTSPFVYRYYQVIRDGSIVICVQKNGQLVEVDNLQGKPIDRYRDPSSLNANHLQAGVIGAEADLSDRYPSGNTGEYRQMTPLLAGILGEDFSYDSNEWYYIRRLHLIAVYDFMSAKLVGWIGPDGFSPGPELPAHRFEGPMAANVETRQSLIAFPHAVYKIDIPGRQIQQIFTPPPGETVVNASASTPDSSDLIAFGDRARFNIIVTDKNLYVTSSIGQTIASVPVTFNRSDATIADVDLPLAGAPQTIVIDLANYSKGWRDEKSHYIKLVDNQVAFDQTLPPLGVQIQSDLQDLVLTSAVSPAAVAAGEIFADGDQPRSRSDDITIAIVTVIMCLLYAAAAVFVGRGYLEKRGEFVLWVVLTLILGLLGLLLMLSMRTRIRREKCPTCGKPRNVAHDQCEHCAAPWPAPALDGTEIFAAA